MPRSKNPAVYPEAFASLIREAATREVTVPCASIPEAEKLRGKLYGFHSALERAIKAPDCEPEWRTLRQLSTKVIYEVTGPALRAFPRDMDPLAQKIEAALSSAVHKPSEDLIPSAGLLSSLKDEPADE